MHDWRSTLKHSDESRSKKKTFSIFIQFLCGKFTNKPKKSSVGSSETKECSTTWLLLLWTPSHDPSSWFFCGSLFWRWNAFNSRSKLDLIFKTFIFSYCLLFFPCLQSHCQHLSNHVIRMIPTFPSSFAARSVKYWFLNEMESIDFTIPPRSIVARCQYD